MVQINVKKTSRFKIEDLIKTCTLAMDFNFIQI